MEFLEIGFIELIDIALVAVLIYQLYKLVKGTVAINIFIGLAAIYLLWKVVSAFKRNIRTIYWCWCYYTCYCFSTGITKVPYDDWKRKGDEKQRVI